MARSHFAPFREKCFQHLHHLNRVRGTLRKPCAVADGQVCAERVQLVAHSAGAAREDERFGFVAAQLDAVCVQDVGRGVAENAAVLALEGKTAGAVAVFGGGAGADHVRVLEQDGAGGIDAARPVGDVGGVGGDTEPSNCQV